MNKPTYLVIVLIFISNLIFAQTLETVMWGSKAELPKNNSFQRIAGTNSDGFYAIRSDNSSYMTKDKLWLEYVSMATLSVDESNEVALPSVGGKQSYYENIFFINDKLILFTSVEDKSRNQKVLYISYLNTNGTLKNKPKEVANFPISNLKEDGFKFQYLEDTKEIMLYYHKTFSTYNGEKFYVKIFDSNLKANFNEELVFPESIIGKKTQIVQVERGESQNLYILVKVEQISTKRSSASSGAKFDNVMMVYNYEKKEFKTYNILIGKYVVKDVKFAIDEDETLVIAGFYAPKTSRVAGMIGGMFYTKLNPKTEKFLINPLDIKKTYYDIVRDKTLNSTFADTRTGESSEQRYSFKINSIELLSNGGLMVVSELFYESFREFKDPETKEVIKVKYYNYLDFLIGGVDKTGKFAWVKRYPKMQFSTKDDGYFSSYAIYTNLNTVKLMYNDDEKNIKNDNPAKTKTVNFNPKRNPNGIAVMHSIYTDGSEQKTTMFDKKVDGSPVIVPRTFTKFDDGFIIYTLEKNQYRFAQFVFE